MRICIYIYIYYFITALLMAARLHEFNRSPTDIVKIVKVHESTLRKRLYIIYFIIYKCNACVRVIYI